jgi:hypothetical protein
MSWQLCRWAWRLEGPLFVGISPAGALNRCRLYVPSRAIWGAITAELARIEGDRDQEYLQVGDELRKNARFSYLYPAELVGKEGLAWLPEYREGDGLVWVREGHANGAVADRRFRRLLLWTRTATAIDPNTDSALEGSLRETECVQPHWRRDDEFPASPVGMVGYVFLRDGKNLDKQLSALSTLFVGGDTRYGLGRMERVAMVPAAKFFGATVALDDGEPRIVTKRTLGHALAPNGPPMRGQQEAIGGWDMTGQQQSRRISGPVWTPGSQIVGVDASAGFRINEHGFWYPDSQSGSQPPSNGAPSS